MTDAMDWPRYRALCDRPDVCSRWMLERTLALLESGPAAAELARILAAEPLPRPADHFGPPATDMFVAELDAVLVAATYAAIRDAAAAGRLAAVLGARSPTGFVAAWREFALFAGAPDADLPPSDA
jgi:hypothetical protein